VRWKDYRQARTSSSYTYDEEKAELVYAIAPDFLEEARHLIQTAPSIEAAGNDFSFHAAH